MKIKTLHKMWIGMAIMTLMGLVALSCRLSSKPGEEPSATITPPAPGKPTLPPQALQMRAAPTATSSPVPPPPSPTPTPTSTPTPVPITGYDDVPMVKVPAGEFIMGLTVEQAWHMNRAWNEQTSIPDSSAFTMEIPQLVVYLDTFSIDKFQVTNARYRRCVEAGVCRPISSRRSDAPENYESDSTYDDYPMLGAHWDDAYTYCRWVGKRLPTEAEWEKAARGTDGRLYPWGNDWDPQAANFTRGEPAPVGSHPKDASPYGVLDMAGNAAEWTADWFQLYPGNPRMAQYTSLQAMGPRIVRGFGVDQWWGSVAIRTIVFPNVPRFSVGFRCAQGPQPPDLATAIRASTAPLEPQSASSIDLSRMVYVPAGEFIMGADSTEERAAEREKPQHIVYLDAFYIDRYEVTVSEYVAFLNTLGQHVWSCAGHNCAPSQGDGSIAMFDVAYTADGYQVRTGQENKPTRDTGWYGARAYCEWAGKRLPTEAEWEKAARGTDGRKYPWGNEWDPQRAAGAQGYDQGAGYPFPIGSFPGDESPYGALDMLGNVGEWVTDRYAEDYYKSSPYANPPGPGIGDGVARGCAGQIEKRGLTVRSVGCFYTGFRCVYAPDEKTE